jgi:uncharacterized protein YoxC
MSASIAEFSGWLLQQAITAQDTIPVRQVGDESLLSQITGIASAVLTISFLVLTVALVPAAWNFRKSYARINELLERVYGDINPLMRHASSIADNVNYVTTSIRVDMQQINQTIASANARLTQAIAMTEDRLREVNALLAVVQEEAEDMFVSTASAVRGARAGAAVLRDGVLPRPGDLEVRAEALDEEYDAYDDLQQDEVTDGNDDTHDFTTDDDQSQKPRIRRRRRNGGDFSGRAV